MNDFSDLKIEWAGEILSTVGYGLQARAMLRPLIEGGASIKLIPAEEYTPEFRKLKDSFWLNQIEKSKSLPDYPVRVNFAIPPQFRPKLKGSNVGMMLWETTRYPLEWDPILMGMNHIIIPSDSVKDLYINNRLVRPGFPGPKFHIMRPTFVDPGEFGVPTVINEVDEPSVKFLFSSNWIPRKNHADLITAFAAAFCDVKDACLIIKCWPADDSVANKRNIESGIRHFTDRLRGLARPRIHLLTDFVTHEAMESLIRSCDVYVSASKAEGFDSASITAMAMKKLVIGIPFGIKRDYITNTTALPVDFSLEPVVDSAAPGYDAYQAWARPNMDDLIRKMRLAYNMVKNPTMPHSPVGGMTIGQLTTNARSKVINMFDSNIQATNVYNVLKKIQTDESELYKVLAASSSQAQAPSTNPKFKVVESVY